MIRPTIISLLLTLASFTLASEPFHIYSPSRHTQSLQIVQAEPSADGAKVQLTALDPVPLGFTPVCIVAHPSKPRLYVAPARAEKDGTVAGALIELDENGHYQSHKPVSFHHGYCYLSLDQTQKFLFGVSYGGGQVDAYRLNPDGTLGERTAALD
ncbi:MAG: beta-propeller fold lactonase family protein, partial [Verrucomicrobiota bacterium]